jgi:hypothetical protein
MRFASRRSANAPGVVSDVSSPGATADLANTSVRRSGRNGNVCAFRPRVYRRACREGVVIETNATTSLDSTLAETSDSDELSHSIRGGIGKKSLPWPSSLIPW